MKELSSKIIEETTRFRSGHAGRVISREEARQIVENITGFFGVLSEWEAVERIHTRSGDVDDSVQRVPTGGRPK